MNENRTRLTEEPTEQPEQSEDSLYFDSAFIEKTFNQDEWLHALPFLSPEELADFRLVFKTANSLVDLHLDHNYGWDQYLRSVFPSEYYRNQHASAEDKKDAKTVYIEAYEKNYSVDHKQYAPLFLAAARGEANKLRELIDALRQSDVVTEENIRALLNHKRSGDGFTMLLLACSGGHVSVVQLLLEQGVDINLCAAEPLETLTPLAIASQHGHVEVVQILLESDDVLVNPENDHWVNTTPVPPLFMAARNGHAQIVEVLLTSAANPRQITDIRYRKDDYYYGFTNALCGSSDFITRPSAFTIAVYLGHLDVVRRILLSHDRDANTEHLNKALFIAVKKGYVEIVELLLKSGADVNAEGNQNYSPLLELAACVRGFRIRPLTSASPIRHYVEVAKLLIRAGADINKAVDGECSDTIRGTTALIYITNSSIELVKLLLAQRDIQLNQASADGWTALHRAVEIGNEEVVKLLVKSGADVKQETNDGVSSLDLAIKYQLHKIVKLLNDSVRSKRAENSSPRISKNRYLGSGTRVEEEKEEAPVEQVIDEVDESDKEVRFDF